MHPKYVAAKEALKLARSPYVSGTAKLKSTIAKMHESSAIPCEVLEDYIRDEYNRHEPHRKGYFIKEALGYAGGDNISDYFNMAESLQKAQKHSACNIRQKVYDYVFSEYNKNEPRRFKKCLSAASRCARGSVSIDSDRGEVEAWLEYSRQHTNGFKSKLTSHFADQAIRTKYVFFHFPKLLRGYS